MILEASPGSLNVLIRNVILHVYRAGSCQHNITRSLIASVCVLKRKIHWKNKPNHEQFNCA